MTNFNKELADVEKRLMNLATINISAYEASQSSLFEEIRAFQNYAKITEYKKIINKLTELLKENPHNNKIASLLNEIYSKYVDILETKCSVAFALGNFNHVISACLMFYIKHYRGNNLQEFLILHRGTLTSSILDFAETMIEYLRSIGWYCDFDNKNFRFTYDVPLYNKMMNMIFENNYFTDILQEYPDYNHEIAWQEVLKSLAWIEEDSKLRCKNKHTCELIAQNDPISK